MKNTPSLEDLKKQAIRHRKALVEEMKSLSHAKEEVKKLHVDSTPSKLIHETDRLVKEYPLALVGSAISAGALLNHFVAPKVHMPSIDRGALIERARMAAEGFGAYLFYSASTLVLTKIASALSSMREDTGTVRNF